MNRLKQPWLECAAAIAIVVFALALLFPMASLARSSGKSVLCFANLHILGKAWLLYAEDNEMNIVGSATYEEDGWQTHRYPAWAPTGNIRVKNFVASPQDQNGIYRNNLEIDEYRGIRRGGLWPYIETIASYHCPSDIRYLSHPDFSPNSFGGFRSYSIGCPYNGYAAGEGWNTGEYFATVYKTGEIKAPSSKIVFVEEQNAGGWNANTWDIFLNDASRWPGDPIACPHQKKSNFNFADGHVEPHAWKDLTTLAVFERQLTNTNLYPYMQNEGTDLTWFVSHYIPGEIRPELKAMLPAYK